MRKKKSDSWLRPRGYIHLTKKFNANNIDDNKFLTGYITNWETVAKHSFLPLIHRPIITRRYKSVGKNPDGSTKRAHSFTDIITGKKKTTAKLRHIYYSTHIDSYIYSYYCKVIMEPLYIKKISAIEGLGDCISAYRKIPVDSSANKNKSNIHFANDVFQFIRGYGDCTVLTFDISAFFDSLDHKILKQQWCKLFGTINLRQDHYNIYKSLTRITYVEYYHLLKELGIKNHNKLRNGKMISFFDNIEEFEKQVKDTGLIKKHPFHSDKTDTKIRYWGIPQGTPISAFLSNVYMLEFDSFMYNEIVVKRGGLYRRYSDDIVVICKPEDKNEVEKLVITSISDKCKLVINKEKVDVSEFRQVSDGLVSDNPLRYLGFEFNGKAISLKQASLSKFYRQMKRAVRAQAKQAWHNKLESGRSSPTARIYKHDLYKRYSHLSSKGKERSFHVYAKDAAKIMTSKAIQNQLSKSWYNLTSEISKYEEKFDL